MSKIVLEYDPIKGKVVPDGRVHRYVNDIIFTSQNPNVTSNAVIVIGSVIIIDAFRVTVKEKILNNEDVIIRFEGKDYELDTRGKMSNWPAELYYVYDDILDRLL